MEWDEIILWILATVGAICVGFYIILFTGIALGWWK